MLERNGFLLDSVETRGITVAHIQSHLHAQFVAYSRKSHFLWFPYPVLVHWFVLLVDPPILWITAGELDPTGLMPPSSRQSWHGFALKVTQPRKYCVAPVMAMGQEYTGRGSMGVHPVGFIQ